MNHGGGDRKASAVADPITIGRIQVRGRASGVLHGENAARANHRRDAGAGGSVVEIPVIERSWWSGARAEGGRAHRLKLGLC